jgi:hypothetical protein
MTIAVIEIDSETRARVSPSERAASGNAALLHQAMA